MMKAYQIKIELIESRPLIWRRVIIPADVTFRRLHDTIQFSMDWRDYHLYEFDFPQEKLRITNDEESYEEYKFYSVKYKRKKPTKKADPHGIITRIIETTIRQPQTIKIDKYLEKDKNFEYVYDFGDYWRHRIELEKVIDDYEFGYPQILEGEGACPPEDVGGIGGYEEFLKAWNDPKHPEHKAMRQWGESQHYREFDIDFRNDFLKKFLKIRRVTRD
ncbi:plasmid pRiA4b ORF-3 family protein [Ectobacillus polymachus]|uniref:plasmid pRiA4b ORF-3 family protein n=1 Tax=Ectobacillus polymachus TaxID=1508806 RepID=UPI003A88DACD